MKRIGILFLSFLFLLLSCDFREANLNAGAGLGDLLPDEPGVDDEVPPSEPPEAPELDIEEQYPFLKEASFWQRVNEVASIPQTKNCVNTKSYAYFGIVRLVNLYMENQGFALFPFGQDIRYYRFLDGKEPPEPKSWELFGLDNLFDNLLEVDEIMRRRIGRSLTLTGITKHHDFDHDLHCRHRAGNVFDLRPFPGDRAVTWRSKEYDQAMNLDFIKQLLSWDKVETIFFNDPEILNNVEVKRIIESRSATSRPVRFQAVSGHDNHMHVEFYIDGELDRVSSYVFEQTNYALMKFDADKEYLRH